jgi:hypothetical protein
MKGLEAVGRIDPELDARWSVEDTRRRHRPCDLRRLARASPAGTGRKDVQLRQRRPGIAVHFGQRPEPDESARLRREQALRFVARVGKDTRGDCSAPIDSVRAYVELVVRNPPVLVAVLARQVSEARYGVRGAQIDLDLVRCTW